MQDRRTPHAIRAIARNVEWQERTRRDPDATAFHVAYAILFALAVIASAWLTPALITALGF